MSRLLPPELFWESYPTRGLVFRSWVVAGMFRHRESLRRGLPALPRKESHGGDGNVRGATGLSQGALFSLRGERVYLILYSICFSTTDEGWWVKCYTREFRKISTIFILAHRFNKAEPPHRGGNKSALKTFCIQGGHKPFQTVVGGSSHFPALAQRTEKYSTVVWCGRR